MEVHHDGEILIRVHHDGGASGGGLELLMRVWRSGWESTMVGGASGGGLEVVMEIHHDGGASGWGSGGHYGGPP